MAAGASTAFADPDIQAKVTRFGHDGSSTALPPLQPGSLVRTKHVYQ